MKKDKNKRAVCLMCVLAAVLLAVPGRVSAKGSPGDARGAVVRIVAEGADMITSASGFAIGQKGSAAQYFVTSKAAIEDSSACYAVLDYLYDQQGNVGSIVPLTQIWSDGGLDLAILKSDNALQRFTPVCVSTGKNVKKGDQVYMMGYYLTQDNSQSSGANDVIMEANAVSELNAGNLGGSSSMLFEEDITLDLLGGPVIDENGNAAGVFTLGIDNSGYVARAVYGEEVIAAAKRAGVDVWSSSEGQASGEYWGIIVIVAAAAVGSWLWRRRRGTGKKQYNRHDAEASLNRNQNGTAGVQGNSGQAFHNAGAGMGSGSGTGIGNGTGAGTGGAPGNGIGGEARMPVEGIPPAPQNVVMGGYQNPEYVPVITGVRGYFLNNSVPVKDTIRIGRDSRRCHLIYPEKEPGISSLHCEVVNMGGTANLIDRGSTYGTYLADGTRLGPNQPYALRPGTEFYIGTKENVFRVDLQGK